MKTITIAATLAMAGAIAEAEPYVARCQMGECLHYDQTSRQVVGQGSAAVPGHLVLVSLRGAVSGDPGTPPSSLAWCKLGPRTKKETRRSVVLVECIRMPHKKELCAVCIHESHRDIMPNSAKNIHLCARASGTNGSRCRSEREATVVHTNQATGAGC